MSAFNTSKVKKINPLDKVIKKNPKYDHIQPTLDTGSSLTKYLKKVEEIKTNYRYQQDEIFKRMKITTFVQLLLQVAEIDSVEKDSRMSDFDSVRSNHSIDSDRLSHQAGILAQLSDNNQRSQNGNNNHNNMVSPVPSLALTDVSSSSTTRTHHSTLQRVIRGIGELDESEARSNKFALAEKRLTQLQQDLDLPYLLLDLRDRDDFEQCHIITALSYPMAMLSRSINNETQEMLAYKNQTGKIIVVYDDDERIGPKAATTLVQRGYDNLFLLSGGMKLAFKKFPDGLLTGSQPWIGSHVGSASYNTTRSAMSSMSNLTSASSQNGGAKKTFDREDIEKLNQYLDQNLMPNDRFSRNSKSSRASNMSSSKASVASSTRTLTSIHEKPWKPC